MADFVLKNKFFKINSEVVIKLQKSGTVIGTRFAPPYASIFMDKVETEFLLKIRNYNLSFCSNFILRIYSFICSFGEESSLCFLMNLINFIPNSNFHVKPPAVLLIS